jgi:hypothetical protein
VNTIYPAYRAALGGMRLTSVVAKVQCAEFPTQRHILSMKRSNDQKPALIGQGRWPKGTREIHANGISFVIPDTAYPDAEERLAALVVKFGGDPRKATAAFMD